ncbi:MAG: putative dehydrogenase [Verrucomicrobiales bacterium]|jgi:predicted dehydrogenase
MIESVDSQLSRRQFLGRAAAGSAAALSLGRSPVWGGASPSSRLRVGVMGLSRGMAHIKAFSAVRNVEIAYVCDVDSRRAAEAARAVERTGQYAPAVAVTDFRRILDDKDVDVLSIATPNFWHAPATILACEAGKHVYVEKPGSHNAAESQWMVDAARKYDRKVQMGNQRRSLPAIIEGIEKAKSGAIGSLRFARCWYDARRGSIGKGKPVPVPDWLDWNLWQGPVPERPFKDNLVHYNWHWHWHYGGGELANNGVHALDLARWALDVDRPVRVSFTGGRYHFDDDQETPDTANCNFDFGKTGASWEGSSCLQRKHEKHAFVSIYGDAGVLAFESSGYRIYDLDGKEIESNVPAFSDVHHFQNMADAVRDGAALNAEIEDAQRSTMLCHYGNIAYRTTGAVSIDPQSGRISGGEESNQFWGREYRAGWKPMV